MQKFAHDAISAIFPTIYPGQLVLQITDACNATCGQCGMRVTNRFPRTRMSLDYVKAIIDRAAENRVKAISFTGGEPFLMAEELFEMIRHAHRAGIPFIRTGTNGFLLRFTGDEDNFKKRVYPLAEKLAKSGLRNFWISIDSASPNRHERMRGLPGVIKGIEQALPIFESAGIYPSANLGINRYMGRGESPLMLLSQNRDAFHHAACEAFSQFYRFVVDLGFTIVNACYPMSMEDNREAVYSATSRDTLVSFSREEKVILFQALMETIPGYRKQIRIFSPLSSLHALIKQYTRQGNCYSSYPCLGGHSFFFVDSRDGNTYPCGYRGSENMGKYQTLNMKSVINKKTFCRRCDWECFRDPSELFGPFMEMLNHPLSLLKRFHEDPEMIKYLFSDLRYYQKCDFF
ncbi:Radical SAM domain protein [Desulfamplus magnetovallimortis]|uniref:Radical SAM domain protein n=1 Tax=Desulfamplus magnetovallimortis TaxID=1246637 RepID=A0A1W1HJU2_9BACT|nr:radical SAM protein [Desulfamplus magnetovallimortis]SLM32642.1 Radical SAM domain protein [Desulfamplus magnetovallimortis]